ncbi:MAG: hypothetical protein IT480_13205 [Gammaproteobacteria bacterium]|nr:hypothetical protein [Gammaproteobacteria bacterium]
MSMLQTLPRPHSTSTGRLLAAALAFATAVLVGGAPRAASAAMTPPAIPELEPGAGIIRDPAAALALGKALFWDEQAGSDGVACASCHFSAGADSRIRNQLSPGFNDARVPGGDTTFGSTEGWLGTGVMPSGAPAGSNYTLTPQDFPLHQLDDYANRNSTLKSTTNDAVSSSGAFGAPFFRIGVLGTPDRCGSSDASIFHSGVYAARQVPPRNSPSAINAAFYFSNFWDGRANNLFNGVGVFGLRDIAGDPDKRLIVLDAGNTPQLGYLQIRNASLASQAVGPPLNAIEMSCGGRSFADLGRRLLLTVPLQNQNVARTDSVLGPYASPSGRGLKLQHAYAALIMQAFEPRYWAATGWYRIEGGNLVNATSPSTGHSQMTVNFPMFWGLAIMIYERTLISDQSRFDSWLASCRPATVPGAGDPNAVPIPTPTVNCLPAADNPNTSTNPVDHGLTAQEVQGFALFFAPGVPRAAGNPACGTCHGPLANPRAATGVVLPVMSEAAYTSAQTAPFTPVERTFTDRLSETYDAGTGVVTVIPATGQLRGALHDRGFFNIGAAPSGADLGNGATDPYGNPLSVARMFLATESGGTAVDPMLVVTPATATTGTLAQPLDFNGTLNRCSAPGIHELGGTPLFPGCVAGAGGPFAPPVPAALPLAPLVAGDERDLVDGGFKTPSLRNVGLTAPYFHSGNYSDLKSVVQFYSRGGSRRSLSGSYHGDSSGTGPMGKGQLYGDSSGDWGTNTDFFMRDVKSTEAQVDALVAFMLTLTDPRVQCDSGPFDHPSLSIRHGHYAFDKFPKDGRADDITFKLPAVGAAGYSTRSGYCLPNKGNLFAPGAQGRVGGARPAAADL